MDSHGFPLNTVNMRFPLDIFVPHGTRGTPWGLAVHVPMRSRAEVDNVH